MESNLVLTSPLTLNLHQPTSSPLPSKFATPLCSWGRSIKIKLLQTLIANSLAGEAPRQQKHLKWKLLNLLNSNLNKVRSNFTQLGPLKFKV